MDYALMGEVNRLGYIWGKHMNEDLLAGQTEELRKEGITTDVLRDAIDNFKHKGEQYAPSLPQLILECKLVEKRRRARQNRHIKEVPIVVTMEDEYSGKVYTIIERMVKSLGISYNDAVLKAAPEDMEQWLEPSCTPPINHYWKENTLYHNDGNIVATCKSYDDFITRR